MNLCKSAIGALLGATLLFAPACGEAKSGGLDPVVTLLDSGAEPRQELRFKAEKGARQEVKMVTKMSMKSSAMPEVEIPATSTVMAVEVVDVGSDGSFDHRFELTDVAAIPSDEVNPTVLRGVEATLEGIVGLSGTGTTTTRGFTREASMAVPDDVTPQLRQMLDGMKDSIARLSTPFPAEPVGIGGKWTVQQVMEMNGMEQEQLGTFELIAVDGDTVTLKVEIAVKAEDQELEAPGMPDGVKMFLKSMAGAGSGETTISLARLIPLKSNVTIATEAQFEVGVAGNTEPMEMDTTVEMTVTGG